MVTVPTYQQDQRLRPIFQQGVDVRATPDAFGAAVGAGMQNLAQGGAQAAESFQRLQDLQDTLTAKDNLTAFQREKMELDYGPNGFLTTQGKNAVDGRANYNAALEELKKKYAPSTPGAAQKYNDAATTDVTEAMRSGIIHAAQGQKEWAQSSSLARLDLLKDQALSGYDKPAEIQKSIGLGFAEIDAQAQLMGWGKDVSDLKKQEFSSKVHSNVALALASQPNGARGALDYLKKNADTMDTATRMDMEAKLKPYAADEEGLSVVNDIMTQGRKVSELPGDIVAEVAGADGGGGPTRAKAFLLQRSAHKDRPGDTANLDNDFADNLAALIQDAPANIREGLGIGSGWRSNERQAELFANSDRTGRMVAFPAGYQKPDGSIAKGSNHLHGRAADLTYNGVRLDKAPAEVRKWVHDNAANYGLRFPMSWEAWHIEPNGGVPTSSQVVPARDGVAARTVMPSYSDALDRINEITDPNVRAAAMKHLNATFEMRSKAESANADAAKNQIWSMVLQNVPMSEIPFELKLAAGREAVEGFEKYSTASVQTDPVAYSALSTMAAADPVGFAQMDLTAPEVINSLSKADHKAMVDKKSSILADERKATENGTVVTSTFKMAQDQLEAVGITTTGKMGAEREEAARQIALLQNQLARDIEEFRQQNNNRQPTFDEQRAMVTQQMMKVIVTQERSGWNPMRIIGSDKSSTDGLFMFQAGGRLGDAGDGRTVELDVKYEDIPPRERIDIEIELQKQLGFKPSPEQVAATYKAYLMNRK